MSAENHSHGTEPHATRRGYLIGFALSAVLTAIPFWLVMADVLPDPRWTAALVVVFAAAQIVVHTVCFLHVNGRSEAGWTLITYLFTGVVLLITISGSMWIMYHLNSNMMPGLMAGQAPSPVPGASPLP